MKRVVLALLPLLSSVFVVPPASAAPRAYVYEIVRLNAKAWPSAYVRVRDGRTGPGMRVGLAPDGEGGYRTSGWSISTDAPNGAETVDLSNGRRYFVASGGPVSFLINEQYWGARLVGSGFRWVLPDPSATNEVAGVTYEQFTRATAPAGRYGSAVFASVPCAGGAGTWTLRADTDPAPLAPDVCAGWDVTASAQTRTGRSWTLEGPVHGTSTWPYRLMVFDFPKP